MSVCKRLLRAIFVLPLSAGHPKYDRLNRPVSHDGSISGLVFLVSTVVILCGILIIGSNNYTNNSFEITLFSTTMIVTTSCAIIICILLFIYASVYPGVTRPNRDLTVSEGIMLKFLWLFTLANIVYSAMFFVYHIDCFRNNFNEHNARENIICDVLLFTYRLMQTGFLTYFSKRIFKSNLGSYYGLLILFLANISVIVIDFTRDLHDYQDYTVNATGRYKLKCNTNSSAGNIVQNMSDFLDPAVLEYSLLSILFISQIWPTKSYDRVQRCEYDSLNNHENTENTYLLLPMSNNATYSTTRRETLQEPANHRSRIYLNIAIAVLLNIPNIILYIMKVNIYYDETVDKALNIYNSAQVTVSIIVLVKCFYLLQTECEPTEKINKFASKEYIVIASFIGSLAYYTMRLLANIELLQLNDVNIIKTYSYMAMILEIYLQTVFIFQMKSYKKKTCESSWMSMEYTCIFMSANNLIVWGTDSFLASTYIFSRDAPTIFYGARTWITFYSLLYPFVIFFRFKCFVAFYGLFHKLMKSYDV